MDFLAMYFPPYRTGLKQLLAEGSAHLSQEFPGFFISVRRCNDNNVHPANGIYLIIVNFREDELFFNPKSIVPTTKAFDEIPRKSRTRGRETLNSLSRN